MESRNVSIRDARPEEVDQVSTVISAAYRQYAASFPAEVWEAYASDIANVRSRLVEAELIVAEHNERLVGSVTFYPDGSRSGAEGWPKVWSGIRLLAVDPDSRGLGIGRALTEECIRRSRERGIGTVGLHTTESMSVALSMYQRMGFQRVPEFDFRPRPERVVMAFRLDL